MKSSKIVLGMTTGILAVAALVSTKANKFTASRLSYYSMGHGTCTYASMDRYFTANSDGFPAVDSRGHWLFSFNRLTCLHRLYTRATD